MGRFSWLKQFLYFFSYHSTLPISSFIHPQFLFSICFSGNIKDIKVLFFLLQLWSKICLRATCYILDYIYFKLSENVTGALLLFSNEYLCCSNCFCKLRKIYLPKALNCYMCIFRYLTSSWGILFLRNKFVTESGEKYYVMGHCWSWFTKKFRSAFL